MSRKQHYRQRNSLNCHSERSENFRSRYFAALNMIILIFSCFWQDRRDLSSSNTNHLAGLGSCLLSYERFSGLIASNLHVIKKKNTLSGHPRGSFVTICRIRFLNIGVEFFVTMKNTFDAERFYFRNGTTKIIVVCIFWIEDNRFFTVHICLGNARSHKMDLMGFGRNMLFQHLPNIMSFRRSVVRKCNCSRVIDKGAKAAAQSIGCDAPAFFEGYLLAHFYNGVKTFSQFLRYRWFRPCGNCLANGTFRHNEAASL